MDKIFKNDTIMGLVAVMTLALVAWGAYESYKTKQAVVTE